jgi:3-isopropylmalate/(R)-2-methylmalate dehydratase small subunit
MLKISVMTQMKTVVGQGCPSRAMILTPIASFPLAFLSALPLMVRRASLCRRSHPTQRPTCLRSAAISERRNPRGESQFWLRFSREHAPQAIARWGIKALIGESFAEIFLGNCVAMGVPCVTVSSEVAKTLQAKIAAQPQTVIELDLASTTVTMGDVSAPVAIAAGPQQMFLTGTWDACGQLVAQKSAIQATAAQLPYVEWSRQAS